jgi:hypothetical protein
VIYWYHIDGIVDVRNKAQLDASLDQPPNEIVRVGYYGESLCSSSLFDEKKGTILTSGLGITHNITWAKDMSVQPPSTSFKQQFFGNPFSLTITCLQRRFGSL